MHAMFPRFLRSGEGLVGTKRQSLVGTPKLVSLSLWHNNGGCMMHRLASGLIDSPIKVLFIV